MNDQSVIEWASGRLRDNTPEDPTFRQRFLDGLAAELKARDEATSYAYGEGATAVWGMLGCGQDTKFPNEAIAIPGAKYPAAQYVIRPKRK